MKINKLKCFASILLLTVVFIVQAQTEAPSWVEFAEMKERDKLGEATLSDYSYSGYHFSEKAIPDVSNWSKFDVTNYGATPNDTIFDDDGIRAAISAAISSNQPAVVYFPAGKYMVSDAANASKPFIINRSNIVLKGAGAGVGGTEIYADKVVDNATSEAQYPWRFQFLADNADDTKTLASVSKRIYRGDFTIEVESASRLKVGQTVQIFHSGVENLEANMPGLTYKAIWKMGSQGVVTFEKHIIEAINGNEVTFKNPVQYTMTADISGAQIRRFNTIEEVGIEDILFTSGWKTNPQVYAHHANIFVDYAYRALAFENVKNGWIRNCEIRDWNESISILKCIGITVENILISGKQGHTSYFAKNSYGTLFENCVDIVPVGFNNAGGQGHGPGMRYSTANAVFLNCQMQNHQSIDCHGSYSFSNLLDNVSGGTFNNNGGGENSYPNSGPYMTFWNFVHASNYSSKTFNFWDPVNRKNYTYVNPIFVGFQSPGENISFQNTGLNELMGTKAYPVSLFDAQLQLRLYGGYMSASSSKADSLAKNANDGDNETFWTSEKSGAGEWLMLDIGISEVVEEVVVDELDNIIDEWKLEAFVDLGWETVKTGNSIGADKLILLEKVITRKLRLTIISMKASNEASSASIVEFKVSKSSFLDSDEDGIVDFEDTDDDNDGTLDTNDPNPLEVVVGNDSLSIDAGTSAIVNLLNNDDFEPANGITISNAGTGTASGTIVIKEATGELTYTPTESEEGTNVTIDYNVCNTGVEPAVCGNGTLNITVNKATGINIIRNSSDNVKIYPNPSSSIINIEIIKSGEKQIFVYNSTGKLVWQQKTIHKKVQLHKGTDLKEGLYFFVVKSVNDSIQTSKVLIN